IGNMIERAQPLFKQWGHLAAAVECPKRQTNHLQTDIGPAAFVRDRKAVTAQTDFATTDQADPNRARAGHDNGPVRPAMGAQTGGHAGGAKGNGGKGMRDLIESLFSTPAAETGKANSGAHPQEIVARKASLRGCRF